MHSTTELYFSPTHTLILYLIILFLEHLPQLVACNLFKVWIICSEKAGGYVWFIYSFYAMSSLLVSVVLGFMSQIYLTKIGGLTNDLGTLNDGLFWRAGNHHPEISTLQEYADPM